jgi:hypothetical protein
VTADELLALLEGRELGLRRRCEQIIEEMSGARDMLLRIRTDGPGSEGAGGEKSAEIEDRVAAAAPQRDGSETTGDAPAAADGAANKDANPAAERFERVWSLRLLRARQSLMQSEKSAQEVLGIAAAFRDIREELINNRVDTQDRKTRLQ